MHTSTTYTSKIEALTSPLQKASEEFPGVLQPQKRNFTQKIK